MWIKCSDCSEEAGIPSVYGDGEYFTEEVLKEGKDSKFWMWGWERGGEGISSRGTGVRDVSEQDRTPLT